MSWKDQMIKVMRQHYLYRTVELEKMTEEEVMELYESFLDWVW